TNTVKTNLILSVFATLTTIQLNSAQNDKTMNTSELVDLLRNLTQLQPVVHFWTFITHKTKIINNDNLRIIMSLSFLKHKLHAFHGGSTRNIYDLKLVRIVFDKPK